MLAVVDTLEKFHYYVYGSGGTVKTDHKLWKTIFKKRLATAPPQIARMMLRVQKYNAEIKHVQGKNIPLANALCGISPCPGDTIEGLDVSVHELHLYLNASPTRIVQIKDEKLLSLCSIITQGWSDTRLDCPVKHIHAFWNYHDKLTVADGVIQTVKD